MGEVAIVISVITGLIAVFSFFRGLGRDQNKQDEKQNIEITQIREKQEAMDQRLIKVEDWKDGFERRIEEKLDGLKNDIHKIEIVITQALKGK